MTAIEQLILDHLAEATGRLTRPELERTLTQNHGVEKRKFRRAVASLLAGNRIAYTYCLGCSFLEISFNRPARVGRRVILAPPGTAWTPAAGEVVVRIAPGDAFGTGRHPTTRLALSATEWLMDHPPPAGRYRRALDIGAGSGALAIAAVGMGAAAALALDTDACARFEAEANVRLNGLSRRIRVADLDPAALKGPFDLILANLRYPTLSRMAGEIARLAPSGGGLVMTGVRETEARDLAEQYGALGFEIGWEATAQGWAAMAMRRAAKTTATAPDRPESPRPDHG